MDEQGSLSTSAALRRALREAPTLGKGLWVTLVLAVTGTAIQLVVPIAVQQIVDHEILSPDGIDMGGVTTRAVVAGVALLIGMLLARTSLLRLVRSSSTGLSDLRVKSFSHLLRLSVLHVQAERRGTLVARVTSDIATLQEFMEWGGIGFLINSAQVLLAVGVMFFYDWRLALLVVAGTVVYAILMIWFQKILRRSYDRVRGVVGNSLAVLGEAMSALPIVRAYGIERSVTRRVDDALEQRFQTEYRTMRFGNILFSSAEVFAGALTAAVLAVGVLLGVSVGTSAGTLLAFLFLVNLLIEPVQLVVEVLDSAQSAAAGVRRVLSVLDTPPDIPDPVDGVELLPGGMGVRFDGVRYRYGEGPEVLSDVTVEIPAGRRVAVVGETGSGKTTFAKLVTRLLDPVEGTIEVGGQPLNRVRFASLRSRLAFVPQEGFLFDTTVADNVRYGCPDAGEREVRTAFFELGLDGWLDRLPAGLDTQVGERGGNLSAGERQLVAVVRAWIAGPDLLVLDEATSAVDPALEVALRRAIDRLTAGRTSITIAHRLSTAEAADEVLVFDQGRLVERGHHRELVAANGVYSRLYRDWTAGTAVGA